MATFTATAGSSTTIGYAQYGSTSWSTGTTNGACQGAYQGTASSNSRVGVMVFSGAGAALQGKVIQSMTLKITCSGAGSAKTDKVLSFRKALYQFLKTGIKGSAQVGNALGTLTGKFYDNTVIHTLSASSNTALFNAMKDYFTTGNSVLVVYNGETSSSSGYSSNYARITTVVLTVTYFEATVWYNNGGTWMQCTVWYCNGGTGVQCAPYYNSGGSWIRV